MAKILPRDITSYDLLKTFAVVIMIVDHIGVYFFPDDLWWRAVGRIGFPIWFFLVGHARGRDLPFVLAGGAFALTAGNIIVGTHIFPLNALFTIALIRISIDFFMRVSMKSPRALWVLAAVLFLLILPTGALTEYGTQALITAIFGYMVRHNTDRKESPLLLHYMIFSLISFLSIQMATFGFSLAPAAVMIAGTALVHIYLYDFQATNYTRLTCVLPRPFVFLLHLGGRRTLEIYVVHLLLFKALALYTHQPDFGLFAWHWF